MNAADIISLLISAAVAVAWAAFCGGVHLYARRGGRRG